jgi:hypothetical protein
VLANCWSHFRRLFYDIAKGGNAPIATEVLVRIAALYAIEDEIRGGSPDERTDIRQARSKPLVDKLETWLNEQLARVSKGSEIAKEIRYGLNHWTGLCRFLDDGRIEIDSNTVERSMRPIALSRKNALFAGSDEGAQNWAAIASLIETCKLNAVNPHAWLSDTLTKLVNRWPASRIDELMPWAFPGANVNGDVTPLTDDRGPLANQAVADAMQCLKIKLLIGLCRDAPCRRTLHGFSDRMRIAEVILVGLPKGLGIDRRHLPHVVTDGE